MCCLNVFHPFWAFVKGFGLKFEPRDEYYIDYKSRFYTDAHPKPSYKLAIVLACFQIFPFNNYLLRIGKLETCYTVRYFDKNNRPNTKALWSERQVAIYHRFDIINIASVWIIVQATAGMRSGLRGFLTSAAEKNPSLTDHLNLHLFFFLELGNNWRAYINFLEVQLVEMVGYCTKSNDYLAKHMRRMRKLYIPKSAALVD
jgi:hypothetical protein